MKVSELIKELQKLPKNLEVVTRAHDNSPLEYQYYINRVDIFNFSEEREKRPDPNDDMGLIGKYVILSS